MLKLSVPYYRIITIFYLIYYQLYFVQEALTSNTGIYKSTHKLEEKKYPWLSPLNYPDLTGWYV